MFSALTKYVERKQFHCLGAYSWGISGGIGLNWPDNLLFPALLIHHCGWRRTQSPRTGLHRIPCELGFAQGITPVSRGSGILVIKQSRLFQPLAWEFPNCSGKELCRALQGLSANWIGAKLGADALRARPLTRPWPRGHKRIYA